MIARHQVFQQLFVRMPRFLLGARVPIALTSRADTAPARTASAAIAVLLGAHLKQARK